MQGAEIAVKYIDNFLKDNSKDTLTDRSSNPSNKENVSVFSKYQQEIQMYFADKWNLSEQIGKKVYLEYSDARIDQGVSYLKYFTIEDMIDILFYYNFRKVSRGIKRAFLQKLDRLISWIMRGLWFGDRNQF